MFAPRRQVALLARIRRGGVSGAWFGTPCPSKTFCAGSKATPWQLSALGSSARAFGSGCRWPSRTLR
eukprot:9472228-Lingulodinium_polyedra.AAC.1